MTTTPHRRAARIVRRDSSAWVMLRLMRAVLDASWEPAVAARRLVADLPGPPHGAELLRLVRTRLWLASGDGTTLHRLRALATVNLALNQLEDADHAPDADGEAQQPGGCGQPGAGVTHAGG